MLVSEMMKKMMEQPSDHPYGKYRRERRASDEHRQPMEHLSKAGIIHIGAEHVVIYPPRQQTDEDAGCHRRHQSTQVLGVFPKKLLHFPLLRQGEVNLA